VRVNGGRLVIGAATSGHDPKTDLRRVFHRKPSVLGSTMGSKRELLEILRFVDAGKLEPVMDRAFPLAEAAVAHESFSQRERSGKPFLVP